MRTNRTLALGLLALAALIALYTVLGPLVLDVVRFRTSASGLDQIRGGDLAALTVVAPVCATAGWLVWREHPAGPVLALAPATYAMYTYSQLILGNEYLRLPGNVERFFPLLLALFVLAAAVTIRSWALVRESDLPSPSQRAQLATGVLVLVMAAFIAAGLHLPTLVDALREQPANAAYLDTPTLFWVVKFYDLGMVVPAAVAVGAGLVRRRPWATKPAYAILGGFVLLAWSVAGMAWTMVLSNDPAASTGQALVTTGLAAAGTAFAHRFYRPLLHATQRGATTVGRRRPSSSGHETVLPQRLAASRHRAAR